jgi:hypothetical protein
MFHKWDLDFNITRKKKDNFKLTSVSLPGFSCIVPLLQQSLFVQLCKHFTLSLKIRKISNGGDKKHSNNKKNSFLNLISWKQKQNSLTLASYQN